MDCDFVDPALHTDNVIIGDDAPRRGEDEPGNLDVDPVIDMSPTDQAKDARDPSICTVGSPSIAPSTPRRGTAMGRRLLDEKSSAHGR
jgi:hypothetical protein